MEPVVKVMLIEKVELCTLASILHTPPELIKFLGVRDQAK